MRTQPCLTAALALALAACGGGSGDPAAPPAAPSGLAVTATSPGEVALAWTDASSDESGFAVERSAAGGAYAEIARVAANATTYLDATVAADQDYSYRVRSFGPGGTSAPSNVATTGTWTFATLGQLLTARLLAMRGDEIAPAAGNASGFTVTFLGFAFCTPPVPLAPPTGSPVPPATLYGCDNDVTAGLSVSGNVLTLTIDAPTLYLDLSTSSALTGTDPGYILQTNAHLTFTAAVEQTADGRLRVAAPVQGTGFTWSSMAFHSADPGVEVFGAAILSVASSQLAAQILDQIAAAVATNAALLPAWVP